MDAAYIVMIIITFMALSYIAMEHLDFENLDGVERTASALFIAIASALWPIAANIGACYAATTLLCKLYRKIGQVVAMHKAKNEGAK